jgi:hypothetical protein
MNQQLLEFIQRYCYGRENAKTSKEIAKLFGCDKRTVGAIVEKLRDEGFPIVPVDKEKPFGLFWPRSIAEAEPYLAPIEHRGKSTLQTAKNLRLGLREIYGPKTQLELEFKKSA